MGDGKSLFRVLFDEQDSDAAFVDLSDHRKNLTDIERGKPHARFVQKEQLGMRHHRAGNREHLLFTAR